MPSDPRQEDPYLERYERAPKSSRLSSRRAASIVGDGSTARVLRIPPPNTARVGPLLYAALPQGIHPVVSPAVPSSSPLPGLSGCRGTARPGRASLQSSSRRPPTAPAPAADATTGARGSLRPRLPSPDRPPRLRLRSPPLHDFWNLSPPHTEIPFRLPIVLSGREVKFSVQCESDFRGSRSRRRGGAFDSPVSGPPRGSRRGRPERRPPDIPLVALAC